MPAQVIREGKTPVTILQELLLKKKVAPPTYDLIQNGVGTHDPIFTFQVTADGLRATGSGKSKKEAKHNAAHQMLVDMKVKESVTVTDEVASPYEGVIKENAVGELQDFCATNHLRPPEYKLTRDEGLPHAKVFCYACTVSSFTTDGTARTKKNAKQLAAQEMLIKLKEYLADIVITTTPDQSPNTSPSRSFMEQALDEVVKVLPKSRKIHSSSRLGLNLSELCFALRDDHQPDLEYLDSIKDKDGDWLSGQNLEEILTKITDELQCSYHFETVEAVEAGKKGIVLIVRAVPSWTFAAVSETEEEARSVAMKDAVQFMIKMRR